MSAALLMFVLVLFVAIMSNKAYFRVSIKPRNKKFLLILHSVFAIKTHISKLTSEQYNPN